MPLSRRSLTALASLAFTFASAHAQLQTARLVKDANRTPGDFNANINWVMPSGYNVVFPRDTLAHGSELWISDGTAKGTRLLKDITPGPGSTYPEDPLAFGWPAPNNIAFRTERDATGDEVWITDGTAAGTVQIYKSSVPRDSGEIHLLEPFGDGFFFEKTDSREPDSTQLYYCDGIPGSPEGDAWSLNPMRDNGRPFTNPFGYAISPSHQQFSWIANGNEIWFTHIAYTARRATATTGTPERLTYTSDALFAAIRINDRSSELRFSKETDHLELIEMPEDAGEARIEQMIAIDTTLYFIRHDENNNRELWIADATSKSASRIQLWNEDQLAESHPLGPLRSWKGALYLPAGNDNGNHELWRVADIGNKRRIASFTPPKTNLAFYETPSTEDFLYFQTSDADGYHQLWRTKGDAASTRPVKGTPHISPANEWPQMAVTGLGSGDVYFAADPMRPENALWKLRGKTNGAIQLTKPEKTTATGVAPAAAHSQTYEMLGGNLLSFVNTGSGHELWSMKPDGKGTRSLWKASAPLTEYGALGFHAITPHGAIFSYYDGADVRQVWVTDGTKKGTRLLGDHGTANNGGYPRNFVKLGDTWYYSVVNNQELSGAGLWRTDGTPAGTTKVVAADGTAPGPEPDELVVFNDHLYFFASQRGGQTALWRSDGTAAGTVIVKDEWYNDPFPILHALSVAGGELTFAITTSLTSMLWHSDGTTAGTLEVPYPQGSFTAGIYSPAVDLNGTAIFQARKSYSSDVHLWRYDANGTFQLRPDITEQHVYPWYPTATMQAVAGTQLFYAGLENFDSELWVTDGTDAGTHLVKDINPGPDSSYPAEMLAVGNTIYFTALDPEHGTELWRSDGTEGGTVLIADIEPGPNGSLPQGLKVMGNQLYFTAQRRDIGRELFVIDLPQ